MGITENIKRIKVAKGIKASDIAKTIGIESSNYHRLESRGDKLTIEQLKSIADALGVGVGELLGGEVQVGANDKEDFEWFETRIKELEDRVKDKETILKMERKYRNDMQILFDNYFIKRMSDFANELSIKHTPPKNGIDFTFLNSISDADMERIYREKILSDPLLWNGTEKDIIDEAGRLSSILNRHRNGDLKDVPSWDDPSVPSYADTSKQK